MNCVVGLGVAIILRCLAPQIRAPARPFTVKGTRATRSIAWGFYEWIFSFKDEKRKTKINKGNKNNSTVISWLYKQSIQQMVK